MYENVRTPSMILQLPNIHPSSFAFLSISTPQYQHLKHDFVPFQRSLDGFSLFLIQKTAVSRGHATVSPINVQADLK